MLNPFQEKLSSGLKLVQHGGLRTSLNQFMSKQQKSFAFEGSRDILDTLKDFFVSLARHKKPEIYRQVEKKSKLGY